MTLGLAFVFGGLVGQMLGVESPMGTKAEQTAQLIQLILQGFNSVTQIVINAYTSASVARLKADVFAAAYAAHIRSGALPEEARTLARSASEYMYSLVQDKS